MRARLATGAHVPHPRIRSRTAARVEVERRAPGAPRGRRRGPSGGHPALRSTSFRAPTGSWSERLAIVPSGTRPSPVPSAVHAVRAGAVHGRRSGDAPAVLHESRRAGLRAHQPARGREGRAVRAVLALRQEPAPALPRRVRRRSRPHRRPHRRRDRRPEARRGALRARVLRVRRRLRRAARRCAPRVRAGVEPAHEDPRVGPADGVPRAVDALHPVRLAPAGPLPLLPPVGGVRVAARHAVRRRPRRPVRHLQRARSTRWSTGRASGTRRSPTTPTSSTSRRSRPRRATRCAACCPRRRSRTSASTAPARRTRRCCCGCAPTRCPRPGSTRS